MKKKSIIKRKTIPPQLKDYEWEALSNNFNLPGWQFDELFLPKLIFLQNVSIHTGYEDDGTYKYTNAAIYGLTGIIAETNQSCVVNFFIRYNERLYQSNSIEEITNIIDLLQKKEKWFLYRENKNKLKAA